MNQVLKFFFISVILVSLLQTTLFSQQGIMRLKDVKPGMSGIGKTVLDNSGIQMFRFEVIGVLENFLPKKDVILVKLLDKKFEHLGVIAGMSGSPLYIDGMLIGALAYGWSFSKDPIAGVTPIEQMLSIKDFAEKDVDMLNHLPSSQYDYDFEDMPKFFDEQNEIIAKPGEDSSVSLTKIQTPLIFNGFDQRIVKRFSGYFELLGFMPVQGGAMGSGEIGNLTLEDGSSVFMQFVSGDISLGALGTVTHRDGNDIYAFGHPVLWSGPIDMAMATGKVLTVLPSVISSFKIGTAGAIVGSMRYDHTNGAYGVIGEIPDIIPVTLNYTSSGISTEDFKFQVARNRELTPVLLAITVANSIISTGRLSGERTLEVQGEIQLEGFPAIVVDNLFSGTSSAYQVALDIQSISQAILNNSLKSAHISSVALTVNATTERRTARIDAVQLSKENVEPGDDVDMTVFLRPFRGGKFSKNINITVPENLPRTTLFVAVGSGNFVNRVELRSSPGKFDPDNLEQLIELINTRRFNNSIYIRMYRRDTGAVIDGKALSELPPSTLSVIRKGMRSGSGTLSRDVTIAEYEIPVDYVISGGEIERLIIDN